MDIRILFPLIFIIFLCSEVTSIPVDDASYNYQFLGQQYKKLTTGNHVGILNQKQTTYSNKDSHDLMDLSMESTVFYFYLSEFTFSKDFFFPILIKSHILDNETTVEEFYDIPAEFDRLSNVISVKNNSIPLVNNIGTTISQNFVESIVIKNVENCLFVNKQTGKIRGLFGVNCVKFISKDMDELSSRDENYLVESLKYFIKNILSLKSNPLESLNLNVDTTDSYIGLRILAIYNLLEFEVDNASRVLYNEGLYHIFNKVSLLLSNKYLTFLAMDDFFEINNISEDRLKPLLELNEQRYSIIKSYGVYFPRSMLNFRLSKNDLVIRLEERVCNGFCSLVNDISDLNKFTRNSSVLTVPIIIDPLGRNAYSVLNEKQHQNLQSQNYLDIELTHSLEYSFSLRAFGEKESTADRFKMLISDLANLQQNGITITPALASIINSDIYAFPAYNDTRIDKSILVETYKKMRIMLASYDYDEYPSFLFQYSEKESVLFKYLIARNYKNALETLNSIGSDIFEPLKASFDAMITREEYLATYMAQYPIIIGFDMNGSNAQENLDEVDEVIGITNLALLDSQINLVANSKLNLSLDNFSEYVQIVKKLSDKNWYVSTTLSYLGQPNFHLIKKNSKILIYTADEFSVCGIDMNYRSLNVEDVNLKCLYKTILNYFSAENMFFKVYDEIFMKSRMTFNNSIAYYRILNIIMNNINSLSDSQKEVFDDMGKLYLSISVMKKELISSNELYSKIYDIIETIKITRDFKELINLVNKAAELNPFNLSSDRVDFFIENNLLLDDMCIICREDLRFDQDESSNQNNLIVHSCRRGYHSSCIEEWLQIRSKCPLCLQSMVSNSS